MLYTMCVFVLNPEQNSMNHSQVKLHWNNICGLCFPVSNAEKEWIRNKEKNYKDKENYERKIHFSCKVIVWILSSQMFTVHRSMIP